MGADGSDDGPTMSRDAVELIDALLKADGVDTIERIAWVVRMWQKYNAEEVL